MERLTNKEVVSQLREVMAAMEIKGADKFRLRAYQNAVAAIDNLTSSAQDLWENGRIEEIPGVGPSLAQHLAELFATGKVKEFENTKADLPQGMFKLLEIKGVGAKTAFKLARAFKINDKESAIAKVKKAAESGKIRELPGFGEKSENDILDSINDVKQHKSVKQRLLLVRAEEISQRIIHYMQKLDCIDRIDALGSLRRRSPTVGDLDFAVATDEGEKVIDHFVNFPEVGEVIVRGDKKASVSLKNDVQVDLMVIDKDSYGSMLAHFTGSKQHNIVLRSFALEKGMSLSEHGIKIDGELNKFPTEESFYKKLGLGFIPPEIRHGTDEIATAAAGKLPKLVELADIKGDLHTHTNFSDGVNTLEEMIAAGKARGYQYIGISDHAPSIQTRGKGTVLSIVSNTKKKIEQLNKDDPEIRVFFGYEVNILANAELSLSNDILEMLGYVIAAIHTAFDQNKADVTKRLVAAIQNPFVTIIGHPSGRVINQRDPIDPDWDTVFAQAKAHNKIIEINSQPDRLDLPDDLVRDVLKEGIKLIINTDAHNTASLDLMKYGVDVARRGWCEKKHVVNTLPLEEFGKLLAKQC